MGPRFSILLASLLLVLALQPLSAATIGGRPVLNLLIVGSMLAGAVAVSRNRVYLGLAVALAVPAIGLRLAGDALDLSWAVPLRTAFAALFMIVTAVTVLAAVMRSERITADTLIGGICVYLLLGISFALLYTLIDDLNPEAFRGLTSSREMIAEPQRFREFLYYSFVTLTTLGYGDITPRHGLARYASAFEAVGGQLFVVLRTGNE